nr:GTPase-associated system all-helical protein GASH [uncultured Flavobacterium sp.]
MITNLPNWYRLASVGTLKEETLEKRSLSITAILKEKNYDWILDCIRLYLGKPILSKSFQSEFLAAFFKDDVMLIEEEFGLEKRVLAGAIIAQKIESNTIDSVKIALSLVSAKFGMLDSAIINFDIIQSAIDYVRVSSIAIREPGIVEVIPTKYISLKEEGATVETLISHIKSLTANLKVVEKNAENQKNILEDNIDLLKEESDIHWWIFRSYSSLLGKPFKELAGAVGPFAISQELFNLVNIMPPPVNFKEFLKVAIAVTQDGLTKEFSINECVKILAGDFLENIVEYDHRSYDNICPIFLAFTGAVDSGESWSSVFEKRTGLKTDANFTSIDLAEQFLIEQTLLNQ